MPKKQDKRKAVSAVTDRLPATISPTREAEIPVSLAKRYLVMPNGISNSSAIYSPM